MEDYIKKIRTITGDKQIDYTALANLPISDKTLSKDGAFADAAAVGVLKEDVVNVTERVNFIDGKLRKPVFEYGNISYENNKNWSYSNSSTRIRSPKTDLYTLKPGNIIKLKKDSNVVMYLGWILHNGERKSKGWISSDYVITEDAEYSILARKNPESTIYDISEVSDCISIIQDGSLKDTVDEIKGDVLDISEYLYRKNILWDVNFEKNRFLASDGKAQPDSNVVITKPKVYDFIPVSSGEILILNTRVTATYLNNGTTAWGAYCFYNEDKNIIGTRNVFSSTVTGLFEKEIQITVPSGASYIRVCMRFFNDGYMSLIRKEFASNLDIIHDSIREHNQKLSDISYHNTNIKSINHRGFNSIAPENTIPAFILSKKNGFEYVETDVRQTSDGVLVLLHNESINEVARNPDGTTLAEAINIADITYEDAQKYIFCGSKYTTYKTVKIATLSEFLHTCRALGLHAYIELKLNSEEYVKGIVNLVTRYGMDDFVTYIGGIDPLSKVSALRNNSRLGIVTSSESVETMKNAYDSLKTDTNKVFINNASSSKIICDYLSQYNIPLEVWNVNTESAIIAADDYVTGFTTDVIVASNVLLRDGLVI